MPAAPRSRAADCAVRASLTGPARIPEEPVGADRRRAPGLPYRHTVVERPVRRPDRSTIPTAG
ncbi:hypothetical protein [Streptomyces sp. NPDC001222]|uniref:hypothetical protein n=1 Tax=Streptomyces sp. NPDC001222 TaxID=3364548 RepID=UPI003673AC89